MKRTNSKYREGFYRLRPLVILALAGAGLCARAQVGNTSYEFMNIPTSAHSMALGGGGIAVIDDDVTLVDQNPALLGPEIDKQIGLGYMHYLGGSNFASARYGMGAGEHGAWSIGMRYLNYGEMQGYTPEGVQTGTFTASDIVFGGSYSHDFNDYWRGGISLNMIYSHYEEYSAFALSADIGMNYYNSDHDLSFSIVLRNMGGQLKRFDKAYNRLPFDVQLGYMQGLGSSPFSLAITAQRLTKWELKHYTHSSNDTESDGEYKTSFMGNLFSHLVFGLQYTASENFYIGLGYNYKTRADMSSYQRNFLSGFSVGAGLRVKAFGVNLAYAQPHKGGSEIVLNLSTSLGELLR